MILAQRIVSRTTVESWPIARWLAEGIAQEIGGDIPCRNAARPRRRHRLAGGLATAAALLLQVRPGHAQTVQQLQGLSLEQLSQIRVTSVAKRAEPLSDAPASIYVISHDDIMRSGATTLPEILRLAPNLQVAQINSTTYAITARGFNAGFNASRSDKLLVLIDGRSVYTPMFSGVYWDLQQVLPEDIERIEVISGPGAALWGANAVNGVINIITRPSSETQGGVLTLGAGTLENNASLQYGGKLAPDLTYRVHTEFSSFGSYPLHGGGSAHDAWSTPQGGFRLDWTPPDDAVTVDGDLFTISEQPDGFIRGGHLLTNWRHKFADGSSLQLLAYYDNTQQFANNGGGGFTVNTYDFELQHNFTIGSWNNIVWGAGERAISYRFYDIPGLVFVPSAHRLNLANLFAQDTISLSHSVKLTLGVKLEDEPYAGVQLMPSARIAWKVTDSTLLWGAVSRAVRSPTPVDVNLHEFSGPVDVLNGSAGFRPETLTAYEVGTRVQATSRASFSVSAFYDVYDDLRSINVASPDSGSIYQFGNAVAGKVYGLEAWGSYEVTKWWRLSAGFSLQHEDLRYLPGSLVLNGVAFVANDPNHQASLQSSMNLGHGVTWDADLRDVGMLPSPQVPGYLELNTRLGWTVTKWLQLSLSGFNLLHARHLEFLTDGPAVDVPRSVLGQASIRF